MATCGTYSSYTHGCRCDNCRRAARLYQRAQAACLNEDTATFYPGHRSRHGPAMAICDSCTVRTECLTEALNHPDQHGIWGGRSERARHQLRRRP